MVETAMPSIWGWRERKRTRPVGERAIWEEGFGKGLGVYVGGAYLADG